MSNAKFLPLFTLNHAPILTHPPTPGNDSANRVSLAPEPFVRRRGAAWISSDSIADHSILYLRDGTDLENLKVCKRNYRDNWKIVRQSWDPKWASPMVWVGFGPAGFETSDLETQPFRKLDGHVDAIQLGHFIRESNMLVGISNSNEKVYFFHATPLGSLTPFAEMPIWEFIKCPDANIQPPEPEHGKFSSSFSFLISLSVSFQTPTTALQRQTMTRSP